MADEQNELEVLEARREILQLEIALARERRAALEAEQKAKKTADNGGEPTLDYVVPSKYPDARHAESLPTVLFYESCYGIGMNLLLEEKGKGRGHEACVPCFVPFHATFLGVKGDSLISF